MVQSDTHKGTCLIAHVHSFPRRKTRSQAWCAGMSLTVLHAVLQVDDPCSERNMRQLTGLSKLQSLCIVAPGADGFDHNEVQVEFPGRLTCLTELHLPFWLLREVSSVSDCSTLCHLQLRVGELQSPLLPGMWTASHLDALARLTHLTQLHVDMQGIAAPLPGQGLDSGDFLGVLRQLPGLRVVGAHLWPPSALPVLQSLAQVTAVYGGWDVPADVDVSGSVCPHIRELGVTWHSVPFQAFPNLTSVTFSWLFAQNMLSLSHHCTGLQRLALTPTLDANCTMLCQLCSSTDGMVAMKSLANLQHLTHLELAPRSDAELTAFLSAAAAVSTMRLRFLSVRGPHSAFGLMQLLTLRGPQEVSVQLTNSRVDFPLEGVNALLVGLATVPKVSLRLCSEEQLARANVVRCWARPLSYGYPLPAVLHISKVPCDEGEDDDDDADDDAESDDDADSESDSSDIDGDSSSEGVDGDA